MSANTITYANAGVDLAASGDAKSRIAAVVASTFTAGAIGEFGGFGGMYRMPEGMRSPVLVSSADGVGTKLRIAIDTGRHGTIGHDLVNHCVNDILVQGARPLFFLDYVAFGKLDPPVLESVVSGIAEGCRENECALIGGETAEMPGLYTPPDYDLAGFIVGAVEEQKILGRARVRKGDALIGFESSGLHTNGYSLARMIVSERMKLRHDDSFPDMQASVSDVLLAIHRSYLRALIPQIDRIHAMAHITGGGLPGNLDRVMPEKLDARIDSSTWEVPHLFQTLQAAGDVPLDEMYRVFNMGVGMVAVADQEDADAIIGAARVAGIVGWVMGEVTDGSGRVIVS